MAEDNFLNVFSQGLSAPITLSRWRKWAPSSWREERGVTFHSSLCSLHPHGSAHLFCAAVYLLFPPVPFILTKCFCCARGACSLVAWLRLSSLKPPGTTTFRSLPADLVICCWIWVRNSQEIPWWTMWVSGTVYPFQDLIEAVLFPVIRVSDSCQDSDSCWSLRKKSPSKGSQ